jgi:tripartite-type tricarboxylate transporter receptor subunit TctC
VLRSRLVSLAATALLAASVAHAQAWPTKPIRWIVPFPPGGSTDIAARPVAEAVGQALGQPGVVENRAGAGGNIGIEAAAKSAADGHTVLVAPDTITSNPHLYKLAWDPFRDFIPVIQLARQPVVLAVHPSLGVDTVAGLVALARREPGLAYATSGAGSQQHMTAEWFAAVAKIQLTHIPYKGGGQAITDLVGGQVKIGSLGSSPLIPHYKAGKLKLLAQSTKARAPSMPEVPTYEEAGIAGLVIDQWLGVFVPAGTPPEVVARLNAEIGKVLGDPGIRSRFAQAALEPVGGSADQFAKLVRGDFEKYARLIRELKIRVD